MTTDHRFETADALADALCAHVAGRLRQAIDLRNSAGMIVSGGKSPQALFERLALEDLPWSKVVIGLADERWVPPDQAGSNESFVRHYLLRAKAAAAQFIAMKNDAPTARQGAAATWSAYGRIPRPFDTVLLGMGDDGHTASLFPGNPELPRALDLTSAPGCVAMQAPVQPSERLSLNLAALVDAREIIISSTGPAKRSVYEAASSDGSALDLPIRAVLRQQRTPVRFFWSP